MTRGLVVCLLALGLLGAGQGRRAFRPSLGQSSRSVPAPLRTLHINNQVACIDGAAGGTEATPYCSLNYASTIWRAGDLFLLASKRDGSGPVSFTRSGTAAAPVVVRGVGDHPVIGSFVDLKDDDFVPTPVPGVFRLAGAPTGSLVVWQTFFPPILVDDPNPSKYTMVDTDGPLNLSQAPDDTVLATIEGTWRMKADGLHVHPFGSQPPSVTSSDFVIGTGQALGFGSSTTGLVFENLTITYAGSVYAAQINGTAHRFHDMRWQGVMLALKGTGHTVENYSVSHVHRRDARSNWLWHQTGVGQSVDVDGSNHTLRNGHILHSWNAGISTEDAANTLIDGARIHGSPNHCAAGEGSTGGTVTIRNVQIFNCQDYQWMRDYTRAVLEQVVLPSGLPLEALNMAIGPITVRNSILNGGVYFVRGPDARCTWEKGSLFEQNIVSATATVERCGPSPMRTYPIKEYQAKCEAGEFVDAAGVPNCMTIRNNIYVTDWKTVITDGMWSSALADSWDVSLVPGSPALNVGPSGALTDILGVSRPQPVGGLSDAGIYEVTDDRPKPVDCVVSDWGSWAATGAPTFANWAQTLTQTRTRTITTPPATGGTACPELTESRTVAQPCETITVSPTLQVTCNVGVARK